MQLYVAYTLSESMFHDVMKLYNSRFSEEIFYIFTCKVQIPVVELPFFSSNTPILKKWIMLPQNVLHINHCTWTMKLIIHFNLVIRSGMHTTLPTNTHTRTHNMPSWNDTWANQSLLLLKIVTKPRPLTCHIWGTFPIQNNFSMFSSTENGELNDHLTTYSIHEAKFFIGQFLFLGNHIFSQLQERVFISPEQLFHCHFHKRFDLKNVHNGCHCQS